MIETITMVIGLLLGLFIGWTTRRIWSDKEITVWKLDKKELVEHKLTRAQVMIINYIPHSEARERVTRAIESFKSDND